MKMFFAMFAAILCAAVVIFVFVSRQSTKNAEIQKDRVTIAKMIELSRQLSENFKIAAVKEEKVEALHDGAPNDLAGLLTYVKKGILTKDEMSFGVEDVVFNYRQYVDYIARAHPKEQAWIAAMKSNLDQLEAAVK